VRLGERYIADSFTLVSILCFFLFCSTYFYLYYYFMATYLERNKILVMFIEVFRALVEVGRCGSLARTSISMISWSRHLPPYRLDWCIVRDVHVGLDWRVNHGDFPNDLLLMIMCISRDMIRAMARVTWVMGQEGHMGRGLSSIETKPYILLSFRDI